MLPVRASRRFQEGSQDNQASPSAIVRILYRGPEQAGPLIPSGYQGILRQVALAVSSSFLYPVMRKRLPAHHQVWVEVLVNWGFLGSVD